MNTPYELDPLEEAEPSGQEATSSSPTPAGPFKTSSEIPVRAVYSQADLESLAYQGHNALPGTYPFVRGIHPTGYRGKLWTMRMFAGFGTAEETNRRFKYLLGNGQTGLSVAFDMPTLYGYDTDDPPAEGEFGKCGVAVSSLADMELLFDGIPLDQVTTSMTINSPAAIIWAMYIATAEKQGIPPDRLGGTLQNDILKEYIAQNEYIFPPQPSMRLVVDTIEYASSFLPRWNPISISGYHIREAGSTAVQELAFTLQDGFEYVRWCLDRGMKIDDFAPRLSFFFNITNDFFEEIAKFRAARHIWAREMKETFGAQTPRSWWLRTHAQTSGASLTAQQPENNVARVALQALAAVLGGCQSLHTNSSDEAWALPSEQAALVALRTQQIIAHETGVADAVDPLGGSFYLETLTSQLSDAAYDYFRRIDDAGGTVRALEDGFMQREIADAAFRYQSEIDRNEQVIVGVNRFTAGDTLEIPLLRVDQESEQHQVSRLNEVRRTRDGREVKEKLIALERVARSSDNLMPAIIDAVKSYATLGEMMGVFRNVFGEYRPTWI